MILDLYYTVIIVGFLVSLVIQGWLKRTYARWAKVRNSRNMPGAEVAHSVLARHQLREVAVNLSQGLGLGDHYNPLEKSVNLSERIFREPSVASAAIAAHETGHALQDQDGYAPMRWRHSFLPLAQAGAQYGPWAAILGWFFDWPTVMLIGFLLFTAALLFQVFSLPVEFDASKRAKKDLEEMGFTSEEDRKGSRKVLRAAAMTYVAGAATAMGQVFVILFFAGRGALKRMSGKPGMR